MLLAHVLWLTGVIRQGRPKNIGRHVTEAGDAVLCRCGRRKGKKQRKRPRGQSASLRVSLERTD